jgi:16S rRNA (guanine527-N7)-methyltransferase
LPRLGIKNVRAEHLRAEQVDEKFDFIVSRAVTRLGEFYPWIKGKFTRTTNNALPSGILYLKGGDLADEIKESGLKVHQYYLKDIISPKSFLKLSR